MNVPNKGIIVWCEQCFGGFALQLLGPAQIWRSKEQNGNYWKTQNPTEIGGDQQEC